MFSSLNREGTFVLLAIFWVTDHSQGIAELFCNFFWLLRLKRGERPLIGLENITRSVEPLFKFFYSDKALNSPVEVHFTGVPWTNFNSLIIQSQGARVHGRLQYIWIGGSGSNIVEIT